MNLSRPVGMRHPRPFTSVNDQCRSFRKRVATIIGNPLLADAIHESLRAALQHRLVCLAQRGTAWDIFQHSLKSAIRNIEAHERGKLVRRFLRYAPAAPSDPDQHTSDGQTALSDAECGSCIEFIFSHMINRFKGDLAELLALRPVLTLADRLIQNGNLRRDAVLYWGETVRQKALLSRPGFSEPPRWGGFVKGADGLLIKRGYASITVLGVIEVKSMARSVRAVNCQIDKHLSRLAGGITLQNKVWTAGQVTLPRPDGTRSTVRIIVVPSTWKLSRLWKTTPSEHGETLILPEYERPPVQTQTEQVGPSTWKVTLSWSQEAIAEAAFEMTYWYMSQVGAHVYSESELPRTWNHMTPEEAGINAVKQALYFTVVRPLRTRREYAHAGRLSNAYAFGYACAVDSDEMLYSVGSLPQPSGSPKKAASNVPIPHEGASELRRRPREFFMSPAALKKRRMPRL